MRKSLLKRNWERAGELLQEIGPHVAPIGRTIASGGTATASVAAAGIDVLARRVRQASGPDRSRAIARSFEKTADYLRYRASDDMARDAWRAVKKRPVWITAGTALGGWVAYRWLTRER
ncbi:MAG: hypothetical protein ACE15E_17655 [Acidobacteriota bacterium]